MSEATETRLRYGRVDERVLGSGTGLRFTLLLVLFLTSSATTASTIIGSLVDPHNIGVGCALAAGADPDSDYLSIAMATMRSNGAYQACVSRYVPTASAWAPLAVVAALVMAAGALYWVLPSWKGRRARVVPLEVTDDQGELRRLLAELVAVAGLRRTPCFVIAPAAATASAVVFGRPRRYTVCLHGGLVARRRRDPEGFRTVVLHELAHIRNRDVDFTYATVALWRVFLFAVLPAYVVWAAHDLWTSLKSAALGPAERLGTGHEVVMSGVMIALVYLARADILRTREYYADLDALRWGADPQGWRHGADRQAEPGRARKAIVSFAALWRTHPAWDRRKAALTDPRELFRLNALTVAVTGVMATITADQLSTLLGPFDAGWAVRLVGAVVPGLIAAITGVGLWRAVVHAVFTGDRVPSGLRAGWWLGVGLAAGELLTSSTSGSTRLLPRHPEVLVLLVAISVGIMWWTAQYAELSVRAWRGRTLRPVLLLGLAATWLIFALWYAWWQSDGHSFVMGWSYSDSAIRQMLQRDLPGAVAGHDVALSAIAVASVVLLPISADPLLMWAAAALWLLPLLVWCRRPATGSPDWAHAALDALPDPALSERRLPSLHRVLLTAGVGTVASWAGVIAVMASMHTWQPPLDRRFGTYALVFVAWLVVALVTATAVTAAVASVVVSRYPLLVALVAAGTAALFGLVGEFLLASVDGCLGPLNTLGSACHWLPGAAWPLTEVLMPMVLGLGMFLSIAAVLLTTAAKRALRPLLRRPAEQLLEGAQPDTSRPDRVVLRRIWVAALSAGVVALSTVMVLPGDAHPARGISLTAGQLVPGAATKAGSPKVLGLQTDAWLRLGGRRLIARFEADELTIVTALEDKRASTDRGFAATRIRPACLDIKQVVRDFGAYFPVPDPLAQREWSNLLTRADTAGGECRRAIDEGSLSLFVKAMNEFVTVADTVAKVSQLIVSESGPGTGGLAYSTLTSHPRRPSWW
ncbi:M48 family metalloprotease [Streptomyces sp. NPDC003710]